MLSNASVCLLQIELDIFWSFRIIGIILSRFENRVPLKPGQCCTIILLHISRLNKNESAIFVSLMCSLLPKDLHSELIGYILRNQKFRLI